MSKIAVYQDWDIPRHENANAAVRTEKLSLQAVNNETQYGKEIQEARIQNGYTIDQLAKEIDIDPILMYMYESNAELPNVNMLKKIEACLKVSLITC